MANVAIITDDPGWHGKRLKEALAREGHDAHCLSLTQCSLSLDDSGLPVIMPGFERDLPDAVFVRGVPGGSLEQVVLYLDVLHALKRLGRLVYNDGQAIERTVDKGMTSFILRQAGVPTPPAWITSDREKALAVARHELAQGHRLVSKPLFGSQGKGLKRYDRPQDLEDLVDDNGVFYLQRYVHSGDKSHDFRVFVIAGKAVAAMQRSGITWLNNVHQGAECAPVNLKEMRLGRLAEEAVRALDMHYAGVDIIQEAGGRYTVLEVNSIPAWKGLQGVCEVDIARLLVQDFLSLSALGVTPARAS